VIDYWEKWQGFEADAMRAIVDRFNAAKMPNKDGNPISVRMLSVTEVHEKVLVATAGGNPPDVVGLFEQNVIMFSEKGALEPLDRRMRAAGISRDDYLPHVIKLCEHKGFVWGLPSVPACLALHYNKKLFREAGLDPEKPPRTIAELDAYAEKLTRRSRSGGLEQLGFSPNEPGWWNPLWGAWFGGRVWDGQDLTCDSPGVLRALEWARGYTRRNGIEEMAAFGARSVPFASGQNFFMAGKIAMELQGIYFHQFIEEFAPGFELGVAPFPTDGSTTAMVTLVQADVLSIPRGAKHPDEAWEFIRFVQRPEVMEDLCLRQRRFSPLKKTSEEFYASHPHPYIRLFRELAEKGDNQEWPRTPIQAEYSDELGQAFEKVWLWRQEPAEAMQEVRRRIQPKLDRLNERWERVKEQRAKEWGAAQ
jgi:multiple sugar transport system substrate-binding protein